MIKERDCKKIEHDICGNPRYYIPSYLLEGVPDKNRRAMGLIKYRGKKLGSGYVVQSYNIRHTLEYINGMVTQNKGE